MTKVKLILFRKDEEASKGNVEIFENARMVTHIDEKGNVIIEIQEIPKEIFL